MDISSVSSAAQTTQSAQSGLGTQTQAMGKAEFMELLVTQLKNQDPLSPMDSQDFAAQLAQFSSLEQLTTINSTLSTGTEADMMLTNSITNTMATNFIGKEVSSYGNSVSLLSGGSSELNFQLKDYADTVNVKVYDAAGNLVRTIETHGMEAGANTITWDGKNDQGENLPGGNYSFEVEATDNEGQEVSAVTVSRGLVSSVRYENGMAILVVNGEDINLADVIEIG